MKIEAKVPGEEFQLTSNMRLLEDGMVISEVCTIHTYPYQPVVIILQENPGSVINYLCKVLTSMDLRT